MGKCGDFCVSRENRTIFIYISDLTACNNVITGVVITGYYIITVIGGESGGEKLEECFHDNAFCFPCQEKNAAAYAPTVVSCFLPHRYPANQIL